MMPIVVIALDPVTRNDGFRFTPLVQLECCEVCGEPAPYGYIEGGERKAYCNRHRPEVSGRAA